MRNQLVHHLSHYREKKMTIWFLNGIRTVQKSNFFVKFITNTLPCARY